jgi:hypothetical protein
MWIVKMTFGCFPQKKNCGCLTATMNCNLIDIYALREIWTWFFPKVDVVIIRGPLARGIISQPRGKTWISPVVHAIFYFLVSALKS